MDKREGTISAMYQKVNTCITSVLDDFMNNPSSTITRNGRDGNIVLESSLHMYFIFERIQCNILIQYFYKVFFLVL